MYPYKLSRASNEYVNPYNVPGTYYPSYNYGKISISGPAGNRTCTVQLKDKNGREVWTKVIFAADLK
jgi:hypothetical protein